MSDEPPSAVMVSNTSNSSYLRSVSHVRNRNRLAISDCLCPRNLIANTDSFIRFPNRPVHLEAYLRKPGSSTVCPSRAHSLWGDSDAGHHYGTVIGLGSFNRWSSPICPGN